MTTRGYKEEDFIRVVHRIDQLIKTLREEYNNIKRAAASMAAPCFNRCEIDTMRVFMGKICTSFDSRRRTGYKLKR